MEELLRLAGVPPSNRKAVAWLNERATVRRRVLTASRDDPHCAKLSQNAVGRLLTAGGSLDANKAAQPAGVVWGEQAPSSWVTLRS